MAVRTWQGGAQEVCVGTTRAPPLLSGQVSISECPSIHMHVCACDLLMRTPQGEWAHYSWCPHQFLTAPRN